MLTRLRSSVFRFYYRLIDVHIGLYYLRHKGVQFDPPAITLDGIPDVRRSPEGTVKIGSYVSLYSRERSNPLALDHATTFITYNNARIVIGDRCSLSGTIIVAQSGIEIGDYTMIGANTRIYDTDFHSTDPAIRREHPTRNTKTRPITIGSNVFIGCHVHILKGVSIADNAVVPAGSIIYRDFPVPGEK